MDQTTPLAEEGPTLTAMMPRRRGLAVGVVLSLLLHGLLIYGYRIAARTPPPVQLPQQAMTVWLRPAPPPIVPPKPPEPPPPPKVIAKIQPPPKKEAAVPPLKPEKPEAADLAEHSSQPAPATAQTITLPPASALPDPLHQEPPAKKFDMNAALKTARKVANEKDPARAGLPVAQLDDHPLYPEQTDTKLARDIASAKRPNCKDSGGAGLLQPLIWLLDKKDSGCKW